VTTSFRAEAVDQFVSNLEQALPVRVYRGDDGATVVAARE
jgi:ferric-dicitrate binding protein FerR (iron transport regulator)